MLLVRTHDTGPGQVPQGTDVGRDVAGENTHDAGPGQVQPGTDVRPGCCW